MGETPEIYDINTGKKLNKGEKPKSLSVDEAYDELYKRDTNVKRLIKTLDSAHDKAITSGLETALKKAKANIKSEKGEDAAKNFKIYDLLKDKKFYNLIIEEINNSLKGTIQEEYGADFKKLSPLHGAHLVTSIMGTNKTLFKTLLDKYKENFSVEAYQEEHKKAHMNTIKKQLTPSIYEHLEVKHLKGLLKKTPAAKYFDNLDWAEHEDYKADIAGYILAHDNGKGAISPKMFHGSSLENFMKAEFKSDYKPPVKKTA